MNRSTRRKSKRPFASKADTKELRDYQRLASQYPPLTHEEILALSRRFNAGRNAAVSLDEHMVVDTVLGGDWSEDNIRSHKDDVIAAYEAQIEWLSALKTPEEMVNGALPKGNQTVSGLYEVRNDNIFASTPWIAPLSVSTVCPETRDMGLDEFIRNENAIVEATTAAIEKAVPRHTPKDVVDRWKHQKGEMSRHYSLAVSSLVKGEKEMRRIRIQVLDSERALATIVNHNLQLAMSRVGKMMENNQRAKAIGVFELIGAANVGLVLGARQFNPELGKKFSTYAAYHIDGQLHDLVNREDGKSGIKGMSLHEQKQLNTILAIRSTFERLYRAQPTVTELQSLTGISTDIINKRLATPQVRTQNIYAPVSRDDDSTPAVIADTLASNVDVEQTLEKEDYQKMLAVLKKELSCLDDDERYVVMARTGVVSDDLTETAGAPRTSRKIAGETGLTMAQVNEKYKSALEKLRHKLELHGWSIEDIFVEND